MLECQIDVSSTTQSHLSILTTAAKSSTHVQINENSSTIRGTQYLDIYDDWMQSGPMRALYLNTKTMQTPVLILIQQDRHLQRDTSLDSQVLSHTADAGIVGRGILTLHGYAYYRVACEEEEPYAFRPP